MARVHGLAGWVLGLLAVLGAGVYFHTTRDAAAQHGPAAAAVGGAASAVDTDVAMVVEGAEVVQGTLTLTVEASGDAEAWRRALLTTEVGGRLDRVPVRESDRVAAGAVVAVLDASAQQLALEEARTSVREAEARYRERRLFDDDLPADVRRDRDSAVRLHSGLERADIQLRRARLDVERTRIRAPFDGRVASIEVVPGQQVTAGSALMTVLDLDPIRVQVHVLESDLANLVPGGRAEVSFAAFPDEAFHGRIETINPVVDPQTRSARVTVRLPNPADRVLPGMYARVSLASRQLADRIIVPRHAILERDGRSLVFVHEDGRARWRYVTTGPSNGGHVEIVDDGGTDGVAPGEIVLTDGHHALTHGARIRLVDGAGG